MLYKCYKCGKEFERSESAIKARPQAQCRSCQAKEATRNLDKEAWLQKRKQI